jgi:hypothetical protein
MHSEGFTSRSQWEQGEALTAHPHTPSTPSSSHPFCFAYLQLFSAFNIRRYLFNVGVVIFGRLFYVILSFAYILLVDGFPRTFLPTGVIDLCWSVLYIVLALMSSEVRFKDLFVSTRGDSASPAS